MGCEVDVVQSSTMVEDYRSIFTCVCIKCALQSIVLYSILRFGGQIEIADDEHEKHVSEDIAVEDELFVQILHANG